MGKFQAKDILKFKNSIKNQKEGKNAGIFLLVFYSVNNRFTHRQIFTIFHDFISKLNSF